MSSTAARLRCEECERDIPSYDTVTLSSEKGWSRHLCTRCYNEFVTRKDGVDFQHPDFQPIKLNDADGKAHTFHFQTRHGGSHIAIEAFEIGEDGIPGGFEFQVLGDPEQDLLEIFQELFQRMRRALTRKHIEIGELGPQVSDSDEGRVVRGNIAWDDEEQGRIPLLTIDGKNYSWEEVGRMLMSFEGWQVKMEVYDKSEER